MNLANVDGCEQIADIVFEFQKVNKGVVVQRKRLDDLISDALNSLELETQFVVKKMSFLEKNMRPYPLNIDVGKPSNNMLDRGLELFVRQKCRFRLSISASLEKAQFYSTLTFADSKHTHLFNVVYSREHSYAPVIDNA